MDRSTILSVAGLVVGFFLLGQAARHALDGQAVVAAIEAALGGAIIFTVLLQRR